MGHRHESRRRGWVADEGTENPWQQHRGRGGHHEGQEWGGPAWGGSRGPGGPGGRGGRGGRGGPPPWVAGLFGMGAPERGRGPRVRRGDVRSAILDVLATAHRDEEPINGYQVIQAIADKSNGAWRPSPGSVYPTIQQLHDEGLVESDDERGRRTIRLTAEGVAFVDANPDELAAVWAPFAEDDEQATQPGGLKPEIGQVMGAVWQIVSTGSEAQKQAAATILADTRRRLYGLLADGPVVGDPDSDTGTGTGA